MYDAGLPHGNRGLCPGGMENGKIIIDASAIPHTRVKKARATDGNNITRGTNTAANISSVVSDDKVYYKFELSRERFTGFWLFAVNRCRNLTDDGGGWRLPTYEADNEAKAPPTRKQR